MKSILVKTIGTVIGRAVASILMAVIIVMAVGSEAIMYANASTATTSSCNCVIFRIDDIEDWWIHDVQAAVLNTFITNHALLTPGMIMNSYGYDPEVVNVVQKGKDDGLFELALHGWNHVDYSKLSLKEQQQTLADANAKLQIIHVERSNIFITPYDILDSNTLTAMKNDSIGILSANVYADDGFLPQTFPSIDPSGITSIPYTVLYVDGSQPSGHNHKALSQLLFEVDDSIQKRGWAIVLLHPQDFAKWDDNGVAQDILDTAQMSTLVKLISQLNYDGRTITSYSGLISMIEANNPSLDKTPPSGSILSPTIGSTVALNSPLTVTGDAYDNVAIQSVEVRATDATDSIGTKYVNATTSDNFAHWQSLLNSPSEAFTTLVARITDTAGNKQWVTSGLKIPYSGRDTIMPSVTITSPTAGQHITTGSSITVRGTASDNVALQKIEMRATLADGSAGTSYAQATLNNDGTWTLNLELKDSALDTIVARATDTSGNPQWSTANMIIN
jgi:peptidoglycan/xylan/chitin deacetylase (PgdA/CDA1 family)